MPKKPCSFKSIVLPYWLKKPIDWDKQFHQRAPIEVEIGFGMGEFLLRMAEAYPDKNFVGIEQHWEQIDKTLRAVARQQDMEDSLLKNIRILKADASVSFERLFAPKSIEAVHCLFPCPWPKKAHIKHRLFANVFLRVINNRLKKGGLLKIVTDFYPYVEWIRQQAGRTGFHLGIKTVKPTYDTKFERKWQGEGQKEFFELTFIKRRHITVPVKEDAVLKNYALDDFDAEGFHLENERGDTTVIFKNMIFDRDRQKAMIHLIVAEENLTQPFWVSVVKKGKKWRVAKAEGQNFFPTSGIARALELVYLAVKNSVQSKQNIHVS